ncbi:ferrochelatase [Williamsia sterculiae]|uniref:Coproporphyrin III ferrochelatase n=1 Tax=Williamsia sterculiae TaxID=1344003 RepID=A0A1N7EKS1_9NOCA|nr:ferrochelatase [Williamsia sterculiae]SIR88697.1 ferrochelatase [Williamsia sterculiae]
MTAPFDAVLVLSFGGPEKPEDVRPFLENVTRGRGVPPERLDEVAQHYLHFGGRSPINDLNRDLIARLEPALEAAGLPLPAYFGNRNWHPMVEDVVAQMYRDGHRRVLVFPTSAWGGYSGCRQYHEDIARALSALDAPEPMVLRKLPQYWDNPLFVAAAADAVAAARAEMTAATGEPGRLVFTAHSVPVSADRTAGPPDDGGHLYSRQIAAASALAAAAAGVEDYDQVWQSRSGPPQIPWLEPDICDHLESLAADGVTAAVMSPIGFVSDHLEVVWDLDNEAHETADELGMTLRRTGTVDTDPRFVQMIVELVADHVDGEPDLSLGCGDNGGPCRPRCCEPAKRPVRRG